MVFDDSLIKPVSSAHLTVPLRPIVITIEHCSSESWCRSKDYARISHRDRVTVSPGRESENSAAKNEVVSDSRDPDVSDDGNLSQGPSHTRLVRQVPSYTLDILAYT